MAASPASYNWGEGNVGRARKRAKAAGKKGDFWSLRVPSETRVYVPRWLAFVELVARPEHYGVQLVTIPDVEYFETVHLDGQIDLTVAAQLAQLKWMSFTYSMGASTVGRRTRMAHTAYCYRCGPVDRFKHNLATLSPEKHLRWNTHTVARGQSLASIAKRYRTNAAALREANDLQPLDFKPDLSSKCRGCLARNWQKCGAPISTRLERRQWVGTTHASGPMSSRAVKVYGASLAVTASRRPCSRPGMASPAIRQSIQGKNFSFGAKQAAATHQSPVGSARTP